MVLNLYTLLLLHLILDIFTTPKINYAAKPLDKITKVKKKKKITRRPLCCQSRLNGIHLILCQ